jgi:fatty-acyl-CoA synthase
VKAETLAAVGDSIAFHGRFSADRTACVELRTGRHLSFAELDERVAKCAGFLSHALPSPFGTRVALLSRNSIDFLVMHFACARTGVIFQPLNWRLAGRELKGLIADAGPELLIYEEEFAVAARQATEGHELKRVMTISAAKDELRQAIDAAAPVVVPPIPDNAPILLLYTSGTTGKPKGVIVTERNAASTALNFSGISEISPRDVVLCDMPMFHVAGLCGLARSSMLMGATLYISDRFVPANAIKLLSDRRLGFTHYFAVAQMGQMMRADPSYKSESLRHLKVIVSGGAPVPPVLIEGFLADGVSFVEGYGLSEAGTVLGVPANPSVVRAKIGSVGVPALLIEVKIVKQDAREAGIGEIGEIWVRGPSVTPGYWRQPETTANVLTADGWFKTGDAAVRDEDGFYRIVDRWKDMFISGGENVYPAEVEAVLHALEGVSDVGVIGVADAQWGEVGCAFVVTVKGYKLSAQTVIDYGRAELARYKVPRYVRFVDAISRTASGKIQKQDLRRMWADEQKRATDLQSD